MKPEKLLGGRVLLYSGDCLAVLDALPENSIDSVCCDPPYHLTSIVDRFGGDDAAPAKSGKTGAYARASAGFMGKKWDGGDIAFKPDTWAKVLRVLKPGGYIVAFASTRGFGRMQVALEDAGFITHPMIVWIFGTGFPKATRVKADGFEGWRYGRQALKPAIEPIYMGQKPFSESTGTANILRWGTGALNIDGCRVPLDGDYKSKANGRPSQTGLPDNYDPSNANQPDTQGRWPANVVHDGSDEVLAAFPSAGGQQGRAKIGGAKSGAVYGDFAHNLSINPDPRGDSGSAARFFYSAKADIEDRLGSKHPTVKPVDLNRWLVRLVTPTGGVVLDPFAGTGSTGEAAWREGMSAVLIERESEYQDDIRRRMKLALASRRERRASGRKIMTDHGPLFGGAE